MADASVPLLPSGGGHAGALAESGMGGGSCDVLSVIDTHPEEALQWLEHNGVKVLGTINVKKTDEQRAMHDVSMPTFGADTMDDLDWRDTWRSKLGLKEPKSVSVQQQQQGHSARRWQELSRPMEACVLSVADAALPGRKGLLYHVVAKFKVDQDANVFAIPALEALLHFKWQTWAKRTLIMEFMFYLVWLLSFTAFVFTFQDEDPTDSLSQLMQTTNGRATVVLNCLAFVSMLPFAAIEVCTLIAYGYEWMSVWNFIDTGSYLLQTLITVTHLQRAHVADSWLSVALAGQCLLLWIKIQYYSRVMQSSSTSFVDIIKAVIRDVRFFLFFLLLTGYSYAAAFNILFRFDQKSEEFSTFWHTIGTMFTFATSGPNLPLMWNSTIPVPATMLAILYQTTISIVLFNLLIAILCDSYTKIMDQSQLLYLSNLAELIDELETVMPSWLYNKKLWCPTYIHFIRPGDSTASNEDLTALTAKVEELQSANDRLSTQLAAMGDNLSAQLANLSSKLTIHQVAAGGEAESSSTHGANSAA